HRGGAEEAAVEGVGPGVVGALDRAGEPPAGLLAEQGPAVAADVVEGPHRAGAVAQDDDALRVDGPDEEVAGPGDLLLAPRAEPGSQEDPLLLLAEDLRRGIEAAGQRPRAAGADLRRLEEPIHRPIPGRPPGMPSEPSLGRAYCYE